MRTSKSFSVLFWVKQQTSESEGLIYARITVDQKRVNVSLKRKVPLALWDHRAKRLAGTSAKVRHINQYIDRCQAQFYDCYQELKSQHKLITAKLIKSSFLGELTSQRTLSELLDYHNRKIENTLAKGSIFNFGVTEKYIHRFLKEKLRTEDVYLHELNYKFICDFEQFLHHVWPKGHYRAMSQNTAMKHIQRLRKIIHLGYNLEWLNNDPFRRWKPTFERREREFLSANELSNLETYHFPLERLDRVRDLFVFSCYTGISYADLIKLNRSNIHLGIDGQKWIITKRQKTKTAVKVPLLYKAYQLILKYDGHPNTMVTDTLLPVITNEKLNLYLKEVAEACGITKNLTFHMARHTFATTVTLSNGVPIETVSKLLGHTKIATTQIYARVLDHKISEDMMNLQLKLKDASG
ncbi:MAG: site-specific integrase [Christiangramia sp.]|nr:integrase [Christiangramia sp.]